MGHQVLAEAAAVGGGLAARWLVAAGTAGIAAWCDVRTRKIPNLISFPTLFAGLCVAAITGGADGLWDALAGMLLLGIPYFLLFAFAGGGAGDSKMMAALGAWVGFRGGIVLLAAVALSGGVLAIIYAVMKRRVGGLMTHMRTAAFGLGLAAMDGERMKEIKDFMPEPAASLKMPYGLAIFVGTVCAAGWVILCR